MRGGFSSLSLNTGISLHSSMPLYRVSPHRAGCPVSCAGGLPVSLAQLRMRKASIALKLSLNLSGALTTSLSSSLGPSRQQGRLCPPGPKSQRCWATS